MRRTAFLSLLFAVSCSGGACGGCVDDDYRFPVSEIDRQDAVIQRDALRVRLTQDFLDFIRPQLPALILAQAGQIGGGVVVDDRGFIRVPLPDQDIFDIGIAEASLRQAEATVYLEDLDSRVELVLNEANGIVLRLNDLRVGIDARLKQGIGFSDASCPILGALGAEERHAAEVSVEATINPAIGRRPTYELDVNVNVNDIQLTDLAVDVRGRSAYCAEPECRDCIRIFGVCIDPPCLECDILCGLIADGIANLANALSGILRPIINGIVAPLIDNLINEAVASINGTPSLVETQLDLADTVDIELLSRAQPLGLLVAPRPGQLPINDQGSGPGLELTFDAGFESSLANCLSDLPPFPVTKGPVPVLSGVDRNGDPYHLGLTMASSVINQALYTSYRGGALCLRLSTEDVRNLTGGAFTLNASLLSLLASDLGQIADPAAPAIIELKPRTPPTVILGSGEQTGVDANDNPVYDWLLQLRLQDLGLAFHVLIKDRYVRVFEVSTDVFVGANVSIQPDNTLEVALGELRIEDFQETFNELLPNANFAQVLPTLLDVALGAFLDQALTFDVDLTNVVADAIGGVPVQLRINDIGRDGPEDDYLTLSATFSTAVERASRRAVTTTARLHDTEPALVERNLADDRWIATPTGTVRLVVGEALSSETQRNLEYQVRVDGGLWSIWRAAQADGSLVAPDARLKMPGWHKVEVRARLRDDYTTIDGSAAVVRVLVDPLAPRLTAQLGRDNIAVRVRDEESADTAGLRLEMRTPTDSSWRPVSLTAGDEAGVATASIDYAALETSGTVELRARDGSGNPSPVVTLAVRLPGDPIPTAPEAESSSSCRSLIPAGDDRRPELSWLILGFGVVWARRRRCSR